MANLDLMQVQVGKESTWGTSVAGTAKLMGINTCKLTPTVNAKVFQTLNANLQPGSVAALTGVSGAASIEGVVNYEDIGYALESMFGEVSPSGGGPYVYAGTAPSAAFTPRRQSLYYGDGTNIEKLLGAIGSKLTIRGEAGEQDTELTYTWDLIGKNIISGSLAALSDRSVNPVMQSHLAVYLDTWAGTMGSTALATTAISFELSLTANRSLKRALDGGLVATGFEDKKYAPADCTLAMTLELNATSLGYINTLLAASPALWQKQVRIKATDSTRIFQLDFAGTAPNSPEVFTDKDGLMTVDFVLQGTYHSTFANFFKYSITNAVAALP